MKHLAFLFVALISFAQTSPNPLTARIPAAKKTVLHASVQRPPLRGIRIGILAVFGDPISQAYGNQLYEAIGNFNNSLSMTAERDFRPGLWIVGPTKFSAAMTSLRTLLNSNGIQVDGMQLSSQVSGEYDIEVQLNR